MKLRIYTQQARFELHLKKEITYLVSSVGYLPKDDAVIECSLNESKY